MLQITHMTAASAHGVGRVKHNIVGLRQRTAEGEKPAWPADRNALLWSLSAHASKSDGEDEFVDWVGQLSLPVAVMA